jgi:hypothetical protein
VTENDQSVSFWKDWWLGEHPLAYRFQRLFDISLEPDATVAHVISNDGIHIPFRRAFGPAEMAFWTDLTHELTFVLLN